MAVVDVNDVDLGSVVVFNDKVFTPVYEGAYDAYKGVVFYVKAIHIDEGVEHLELESLLVDVPVKGHVHRHDLNYYGKDKEHIHIVMYNEDNHLEIHNRRMKYYLSYPDETPKGKNGKHLGGVILLKRDAVETIINEGSK